jgi:hypothetical protein
MKNRKTLVENHCSSSGYGDGVAAALLAASRSS